MRGVCPAIVTDFGILILAGCHRTANNRNPREKLALAGLDNLRQALNQAACQKIFDEADAVFGASQTDWLEACERMRRSLGWWKSFDAQLDHTDGVPLRVVV